MPKIFSVEFRERMRTEKAAAVKRGVATRKEKKTSRQNNKGGILGKKEKTASVKKGKNSESLRKGTKSDQVCVGACKLGGKCGCLVQGQGKPSGHVGCTEVDRMLKSLRVNPKNVNLCVKAAIMRGHIEITGGAGDLEQMIIKEEGKCGHMIVATLGDLLRQPVNAGLDCEDSCDNATVTCKECNYGLTYVASVCEGNFSFDSSKLHNHCRKCPGFGQCNGDNREAHHCSRCGGIGCGKHYFRGMAGTSCDNCKKIKKQKQSKPARGASLMMKIAALRAGDMAEPEGAGLF